MSIQNEIDRISTAVQNAHLKVIEKGGTSAAPYLVANLPEAIDTIPEGIDTSDATASSGEILQGYTAYVDGKKVTGGMPALSPKPPTVSVNANGLVTATSWLNSKEGHIRTIEEPDGEYDVTLQLPTQAAQTITPGTADKTIASGRYLTGTQTIKGDSNLKAGNIKSGVSIFGVAGTVEEGEDVTAETETYTDLLTDLEAAVDALPDAGSGGSVETCTVVLETKIDTSYRASDYTATVFENGAIATRYANNSAKSVTIENVVCGSVLAAYWNRSAGTGMPDCTNANLRFGGGTNHSFIEITASAGGTATITNGSGGAEPD